MIEGKSEIYNEVEKLTLEKFQQANNGLNNDDTREDAMAEGQNLLGYLITLDKEEADRLDKRERREIEKEKNRIEDEKQKLSTKKMIFEMAKVLLPTALSLIGFGVYQARMMEFEKTDNFTTFTSREMHLPRFWK